MTQVEIEAMIRKYAIILDGDKLAVRIRPRTQAEIDVLRAARDEIAKYLTDVAAAEKAAYEARQARIRLNVPGLDEVREAIEASRRQYAAFERAMDRGDGRLPPPPRSTWTPSRRPSPAPPPTSRPRATRWPPGTSRPTRAARRWSVWKRARIISQYSRTWTRL
jgi:hypothetical protein